MIKMKYNWVLRLVGLVVVGVLFGCSHGPVESVSPAEAARINRKLVRNAVTFGPGAEQGAVVPDVSSPCLRAEVVPERVENNRLVEKHREWTLDCEVRLLGIPKDGGK